MTFLKWNGFRAPAAEVASTECAAHRAVLRTGFERDDLRGGDAAGVGRPGQSEVGGVAEQPGDQVPLDSGLRACLPVA